MQKFKNLIRAMPLMEQAFTVKKSTWVKYMDSSSILSKILYSIFDNKESVQISRGDLFAYAEQKDLKYFIVATILWGYPRGMRGNHFNTIWSQLEELEKLLIDARNGIIDWSKHYEEVNNIKGLGLSTYSKFLYFLKVKVEGNEALILDMRIAKVLQNAYFKELISIRHVTYNNAVYNYPSYLKCMANISNLFEVDIGKVEMFIFEFGLNLK